MDTYVTGFRLKRTLPCELVLATNSEDLTILRQWAADDTSKEDSRSGPDRNRSRPSDPMLRTCQGEYRASVRVRRVFNDQIEANKAVEQSQVDELQRAASIPQAKPKPGPSKVYQHGETHRCCSSRVLGLGVVNGRVLGWNDGCGVGG